MTFISKWIAASVLVSLLLPGLASAFSANPILSRGKTVYSSNGNAPYLVDGKFQGQTFAISGGSWIAIKVGPGPSKIFVVWNNPVSSWSNELSAQSCPNSNPMPADYDFLTSSNSTNGSDGTWTPAAAITGNIVTARGHLIAFDGAAWVKMAVKKGNGTLDEFEVFDASKGNDDTWFFAGTSITEGSLKGTAVTPNFADQAAAAHPAFNPAVVRGGIGCINSTDMVRNLSKYLAAARSAHIWAIEMGTNDGWGGSNANVSTFTRNLQTVIDSCKNAGIVPIIARPMGTNPAATGGWQLHEDYAKAVDNLAAKNGLPAGPDFFGYFKAHPAELRSDGVHPAAAGAASIQKLWAQTAASLYTANGISRRSGPVLPKGARLLSLRVAGGHLELRAAAEGTAYLYGPGGRLLGRIRFAGPGEAAKPLPGGVNFIRFVSGKGREAMPVLSY
jgi:lysophospholipase L1-like esterase